MTRLNAAIAKAVGTNEIKTAFARQGLDPHTGTPEEFAAFLRKELTRSAMLIKLTGAQPE